MSEREDLAAEVEPWLQECGSCDAALPMACTCPKGDYRSILLKVWRAYEAAPVVERAEIEQVLTDHAVGRHVPKEATGYRAVIADAMLALLTR